MQPNDQDSVDQTNNATPVDVNTNPEIPQTEPVQVVTPEAVDSVDPVTQPVDPVSQPETTPPPVTEPQVVTPDTTSPETPITAADTPTESSLNTDSTAPSPTPATVAGVVAAAPAVTSASSPKKGKKKFLVIAGIVAVVLLLVAGSAAAYVGLILPNNPQKITGDALSNTVNPEKFKSTKFEGEVTLSGGDISKTISSVGFEGGFNVDGQAVDLTLTANTAVTKVNLDVRSTDGKSLYLKVSGLNGLDKLLASAGGSSPEAGTIAQFAPLLSQVNDKWFTIDQSLLGQVGGGEVATGDKLSKEDAQKIGEIYKKHQFLNVDKKLADQDIHGVPSYHIQTTINKDELKAFMGEVKSANIKGVKIDQKDIDELSKVDFSKYPLEMWVSKKSRFVTQLSTSFEDKGTTYKVRIALKDINQPVNVEKPANAHSILELLGGLTGGGASPLMNL
jgi:hypothetical protein